MSSPTETRFETLLRIPKYNQGNLPGNYVQNRDPYYLDAGNGYSFGPWGGNFRGNSVQIERSVNREDSLILAYGGDRRCGSISFRLGENSNALDVYLYGVEEVRDLEIGGEQKAKMQDEVGRIETARGDFNRRLIMPIYAGELTVYMTWRPTAQ